MKRQDANLSLVRNIGISAHIDSGKTTLTERMLFYTGRINNMVEVRSKDGHGPTMDSMKLEIEKGITIQSAATQVRWSCPSEKTSKSTDYKINIIDTPGHVDFTIEVERALRVLDGAVLVLCSVAGVQSQSMTVDRQMRRYQVPAIAFVNKCDRPGADPLRVCKQLREVLGHHAVMIQHPLGLEHQFEGVADLIDEVAYFFDGKSGETVRIEEIPAAWRAVCKEQRLRMIEAVASVDDEVANLFLEERPIPRELLLDAIARATQARRLTPVCVGSALANKGVQSLLDKVCQLLPSPLEKHYTALDQDQDEAVVDLAADPSQPLVMLAFKLDDGSFGQLTYCRVYQGRLAKGDTIFNTNTGKKHKVGRLVQMHANKMSEIESAEAGDIVALFGIDCASGDTFTDGRVHYTMTSMHVPDAVISLAIQPKDKAGLANFSKALHRFTKEDPTFRLSRDEESGQTVIAGMGELHLEVYLERIRREYGVEVESSPPHVAYRETVTRRANFAYTHRKQTGGSGQYARIAGFLGPAPEGEVYVFQNDIVSGSIPKEYQPACDKGFRAAMKKGGLLGAPIIGVTACINDGEAHKEDSSDMAFQIAAEAAFREVYLLAQPVILEPIMRVVVETPEEFTGAVFGSLNARRGVMVSCTHREDCTVAEADVPLAEMFGYSGELRGCTQGKAEFSMEFQRYAPVPQNIQEQLIAEASKKSK
ncbi:MAG: elongation factor G [Myxococcales bacterium]|nr:elongation factor G [Myxococcales bacterium]MCB9641988.1 elongation factor G [Myxococcales bacterium]